MKINNPKIDEIFEKAKKWKDEMVLLRDIVLDCELTEELKWYQACYTYNGSNVLIISGFKDYVALNFFKGSLINDTHGILVQPTVNVQAGRQIRFTSVKEITKQKTILKAYVKQAIEVEKSGLKVTYKKTEEFDMPEEFRRVLKEMPEVREAFESLTPGRQRAYVLHFAQAKLSRTRESRIEKNIPAILSGKGLND
jgi:uncharacterized protein YdeI (YjbR/CyaY-like superfamily)